MNCNNKHCYWNYDNMCVHESYKEFLKATPNELNCPASLRGDFETARILIQEELKEHVVNLGFTDMIKVRKMILEIKNK